MTRKLIFSAVHMLVYVFLLGSGNLFGQLQYPYTKQVIQMDDYFGTKISDPYRWLENDTSAETKAWVRTEQQFTENYLSKISFRDQIRNRYKEILSYTKYFGAFKAGDYIIYSKSEGLQDQPVYYFQKGLNGSPKILIDPNTLSKDGSVSISLVAVSNNQKYLLFHTNTNGSDWETIYIMDIATQTKLKDEIKWTKFENVTWCGNGFYYGRFDEPAKGTELTAKNENGKIYYHTLGDTQENDKLIFEEKEHPDLSLWVQVTQDEHYLFVFKSPGTYENEVWYKDLRDEKQKFTLLFKGYEHSYGIIQSVNNRFIVYTNDRADNYRVVLVDPEHPGKENWKEIIPEKKEALESVSSVGGKLFCFYLKDASSRIFAYDLNGKSEQQIKLPCIGSAMGIRGFKNDTTVFYDFSSFTYPPSIFCYSIAHGISKVFKKSEANIDLDKYTTDQVFYNSKDGTKVPMFLVHKKDLQLNSLHPTLLYAYGGFNISETPHFSASNFILLEQNGIYALANIRGGGEYGEKWHKGGSLLNKQNVFDDFIAGAEYLIQNRYTTRDLLAINGGSNGGLLIGAVITQRPDLFKVSMPVVGVMDMLRFQKFTIGSAWTSEYGSSDSTKYFPYLLKYSPLHNIKKNTYPAIMVFTADHDDRVVPAHSFKFAATLQANQCGNNPVLIRIDTKQGHGVSSTSGIINEQTDKWSFMLYNMHLTPEFIKQHNANE